MSKIVLKLTYGNPNVPGHPKDFWLKFLAANDISLLRWYWHREYRITREIQILLYPYSAGLDVENDQLIFESEADKLEFLLTWG